MSIFFGASTFVTFIVSSSRAKKEAEKIGELEVKKWLKEQSEKIQKPLRDMILEGEDLLHNIREEADSLLKEYQLSYQNHNIMKKLNDKEKEDLSKVNILLQDKDEEKFTYSDWYSKLLSTFYKSNFIESINYTNMALNKASDDGEKSQAMFFKAYVLGLLSSQDRIKESISVYNEIINSFKDSTEDIVLSRVRKSILNKYESLLILGKDINSNDIDLFNDIANGDNVSKLEIQILNIIRMAREVSQDMEIEEWLVKYDSLDMRNDFRFNELKTWSETLEPEAKERVQRYIKIFEDKMKEDSKKQENPE